MRYYKGDFAVLEKTYSPFYVKIHKTNCHLFKRRKNDRSKTGIWHYPFKTYEEAKTFANKLEIESVSDCYICNY